MNFGYPTKSWGNGWICQIVYFYWVFHRLLQCEHSAALKGQKIRYYPIFWPFEIKSTIQQKCCVGEIERPVILGLQPFGEEKFNGK